MPILTDDEWKTVIAGETGASDFASDFDTLFPLWWKLYAAKGEDLQSLYTKARTLEFLMGKYRARYDVVRGTDQSKIQQQFANSNSMFNMVWNEIKAKDPEARSISRLNSVQMNSTLPDLVALAAHRLRVLGIGPGKA